MARTTLMRNLLRRRAFRLLPTLAALAATLAFAAACAGDDGDGTAVDTGSTKKATVTFWWWGEDEAPGLRAWLAETAEAFEQKNPNITIELVQQTIDGLIPSAQAAQAAEKGPDIQFYWPVGWFQTDMFNGGLEPLDELMPDEVEHYLPPARDYASFDGHVYAAPLYSVANPWVYRKDLFARAGLDPENPPRTYADFLDAGKKLSAAGITPIAAGMKDQWYADWPWFLWQACSLDSAGDWFDGFLGRTPKGLADPKFETPWKRLDETIRAGFYPKNVTSLPLYDGFNLFLSGKAAMAHSALPTMAPWMKELGPEKMGIMLTPCEDEGALGGRYPVANQYVAIPKFAKDKKEAAQFIAFMHSVERMRALAERGYIIPDDRLTPDMVPNPLIREALELEREGDPYFALYYTAPPTVDEWIWPIVSKLFQKDITPAQAAKTAEESNARWRAANEELAESFAKWEASVVQE